MQASQDKQRRTDADVARLLGELDQIERDSVALLGSLGVPLPASPRSRTRRQNGAGMNAVVGEINSAIADLQHAADEVQKARLTIEARVRRKIGLPP